ncbi:MAG TPA: hemerythrin family protein [Candidatus Sulfotelmatobacter sp.]|jgi:hemerythrin-like metal-binding protein|nr:hemerythrin family protein [Candidatus Sulfotelmatobacter sp.]
MFEWEEDYKIGLPEMDAEHLVLFALINQIEINVNGEKADDCLRDVLGALLSYVTFHFSHEQEVMAAHGYPGLADHIRQHEEFSKTVHAMAEDDAEGGLEAALKLRGVVLNWLINHILRADADYAAYIRGK